jgi:hypothetical protein
MIPVLIAYAAALLSLSVVGGRLHNHQTCKSQVHDLVSHALIKWPSISQSDVDGIIMDHGFRVQRLNEEWYVSAYPRHERADRPYRNAALKLWLLGLSIQASSQLIKIPDGLDFYIDTSDGNANKGPAFAFCFNNVTTPAIMIPDYSLLSWPDSGQNYTWGTMYLNLINIGMLPKVALDKAIFYGNMFARRKRLAAGASSEFTRIVDTRRYSLPQGQQPTYMPIEQICIRPYLIHISGKYSYSSRLKYLLLCNSTVIVLDDFKRVDALGHAIATTSDNTHTDIQMNHEEWFYALMKPWVHYVPAHNGTDLNRVMKYLLANPHKAREIANNGAKLAMELLHPYCIGYYWTTLLVEYSKRMTYKTKTLHPGAVSLTNSLIIDVQTMEESRNPKSESFFKWW